jgi:hypothetical protein
MMVIKEANALDQLPWQFRCPLHVVLLECSGWGVADAILGVIEPSGTYPGQERQGQPSRPMGCAWSVRSTSPWCYLAARRISNLEPPLGVG